MLGAGAGDFQYVLFAWREWCVSREKGETDQRAPRSQRYVSFSMGYQAAGTVPPLQHLGHFP
jgi:hypothetical protein